MNAILKLLCLLILFSLFIHIAIAGGELQVAQNNRVDYFIRPDGIWLSKTDSIEPFITIGMTVEEAIKKIGRNPDGLSDMEALNSTNSVLKYITPVKGEIYGFYLYKYNVFNGTRDTSQKPTVRTIEIWSTDIKTLKGVGVGNTCSDVWKAHGNEYKKDILNPLSAGFYYNIGSNNMFFIVGPQPSSPEEKLYPENNVKIRYISIF